MARPLALTSAAWIYLAVAAAVLLASIAIYANSAFAPNPRAHLSTVPASSTSVPADSTRTVTGTTVAPPADQAPAGQGQAPAQSTASQPAGTQPQPAGQPASCSANPPMDRGTPVCAPNP